MFSSRIPLKHLINLCRSLGMQLDAGVPILQAMKTCSRRIGGPGCQSRLKQVVQQVESGEEIAVALREHGDYFPKLFIDLIAVGETSGALPEVLRSLADHYENLMRLRRDFIGQIAYPVLQLVAAICILSFVIYILGMIAGMRGTEPIDIFGWGLVGTTGALTFFFGSFGTLFGIWFLYYLAARNLPTQQKLHSIFLRIPVLGPCLRSFAIARFAWAYALTQQAGMRVVPSLEASLKATGNGAFETNIPRMTALIQQGEDLSTVVYDSGLFGEEFVQMVQVAETSGTVPETLERLSPQFEDSARRSLAALAKVAGWVVWAIVAGFIIFAIFSIAQLYLGALADAAKGI